MQRLIDRRSIEQIALNFPHAGYTAAKFIAKHLAFSPRETYHACKIERSAEQR